MTNAEKSKLAQDYLMQIPKLKQNILLIDSRIEELKERSQSVSSVEYGERFHRSGNDVSRTERLHIQIEGCIEKLIAKHTALLDLENRIIGQIERMPFENEKNVLMWHYIEGRNLEETSVMLGYTYRHTTRIHGTALLTFHALYLDDTCTMLDSPF